MFEWLFPTWTNPAVLALIVGARTLANGALAVLVARSRSPGTAITGVAAGLALLSTALTVSVLRGDLGLGASYLEFAVQVALVGLAGVAVRSNPSTGRWRATALAAFCAVGLLLITIPLYGEATVAP
ncbi:hypothetical protein [Halorarum salinum]|uniref:Uncharacterized protein n=1 Tax=Halorarum salinum TaxID=2743089 RepID=A0A7D5LAZ1_9EURY|nr:hypothetical protein HUG12_10755 [Halobaculum salinum]